MVRAMDERQREIYRRMTPEQKLRIVSDLRIIAWKLKEAWIRSQNPDWDDDRIQRAVRDIFLHANS